MPIRVASIAVLVMLPGILPADTFGPGFTNYSATVLPQPAIPFSYGALIVNPADYSEIIIGGGAGGASSAFYLVPLKRDNAGHIVDFTMPGSIPAQVAVFANAPRLDSGATFGPFGMFAYTLESASGGVDVGTIRAGSTVTNRTVNIVTDTPGSINFVPYGYGWPAAGQLKLLTNSGKFYSVQYHSDGSGYVIDSALLSATLPVGNVEGFAFVKAGPQGFPNDTILVAERGTSSIVAYTADTNANPIPGTRRVFLSGPPLQAPQGLAFDPGSGDLLVSTRANSSSVIYRISGFNGPNGRAIFSISQCGEITVPADITITQDLTESQGRPCLDIHDVSRVNITCYNSNARIDGAPSIRLTNVYLFHVGHCRLDPTGAAPAVEVFNSGAGSITEGTIGNIADTFISPVSLLGTRDITLSLNTVYGIVQQWNSVNNSIRSSTFHVPALLNQPAVAAIASSGQLSSTINFFGVDIRENQIDGQSSPSSPQLGAQRGIFVQDADHPEIKGNTIRNTSLAGIETSGNITNAIILGNNIENTVTGIAGNNWNSWTNVQLQGNSVVNASQLFNFTRRFGLRPANWNHDGAPADTGVFFRNNVISANSLSPGAGAAEHAATLPIYDRLRNSADPVGPFAGERAARPSEFFLDNNIFRGNNFGKGQKAPDFAAPLTPGKILDQGANVCAQPVGAYPLTCQ